MNWEVRSSHLGAQRGELLPGLPVLPAQPLRLWELAPQRERHRNSIRPKTKHFKHFQVISNIYKCNKYTYLYSIYIIYVMTSIFKTSRIASNSIKCLPIFILFNAYQLRLGSTLSLFQERAMACLRSLHEHTEPKDLNTKTLKKSLQNVSQNGEKKCEKTLQNTWKAWKKQWKRVKNDWKFGFFPPRPLPHAPRPCAMPRRARAATPRRGPGRQAFLRSSLGS